MYSGVIVIQSTSSAVASMQPIGKIAGPSIVSGRSSRLHITSRVNTAQGIVCRAVAEELPDFVEQVEPALEDAYLYLISREAIQ